MNFHTHTGVTSLSFWGAAGCSLGDNIMDDDPSTVEYTSQGLGFTQTPPNLDKPIKRKEFQINENWVFMTFAK